MQFPEENPGEEIKSLQCVLSLRLPHRWVKRFAVDLNSRYLTLVVSDGDVYIYELQKAIEAEKALAVGKKKMAGLTDRDVFCWLDAVSEEDLLSVIGRAEAATLPPEEGRPPVRVEDCTSFVEQQHLLAATGSPSRAGGI